MPQRGSSSRMALRLRQMSSGSRLSLLPVLRAPARRQVWTTVQSLAGSMLKQHGQYLSVVAPRPPVRRTAFAYVCRGFIGTLMTRTAAPYGNSVSITSLLFAAPVAFLCCRCLARRIYHSEWVARGGTRRSFSLQPCPATLKSCTSAGTPQ
jgi:hypothetical protein